jgi:hypothetical protein
MKVGTGTGAVYFYMMIPTPAKDGFIRMKI